MEVPPHVLQTEPVHAGEDGSCLPSVLRENLRESNTCKPQLSHPSVVLHDERGENDTLPEYHKAVDPCWDGTEGAGWVRSIVATRRRGANFDHSSGPAIH